jgi:phospholipid/cholesterol/gamma-HCH transport system permease protein
MITRIGNSVVGAVEQVGEMTLLGYRALLSAFRPPYRMGLFVRTLDFVGVGSLLIITLSGVFTGAVFAVQTARVFGLFNAESLVGSTVAIALSREMAPVFAGLMVAARVGSAIATEIGTMRVTEQIDALEAMAVNPVQYLVSPRIVAGIVMLPVLTMIFNAVGMGGAYFVGVELLGVDPGLFIRSVETYLELDDVTSGLIKSVVFGFLVTLVGCYQGFTASGGASGVGVATTRAVVYGSVMTLVSDYFLTVLMY